jgi:hypothetical protein
MHVVIDFFDKLHETFWTNLCFQAMYRYIHGWVLIQTCMDEVGSTFLVRNNLIPQLDLENK